MASETISGPEEDVMPSAPSLRICVNYNQLPRSGFEFKYATWSKHHSRGGTAECINSVSATGAVDKRMSYHTFTNHFDVYGRSGDSFLSI